MPKKIPIAIVDDQHLIRKALAVLINMFPDYYVLLDAENGKDLQAQLKENQLPKIVLLDIVMPIMDGYETARWLRDNHSDINTLALSTMDKEDAIIKMIKNGACGYIFKDANTDELKQALDEVVSEGFYYNDFVTQTMLRKIHIGDEKKHSTEAVKLTDRELQFLCLACSEQTYHQIASEMGVSERTVDGYREALCKKLQLSTRVGLVMFAIKNKLVTL